MEIYKTASVKKVGVTAPVVATAGTIDVVARRKDGKEVFDFSTVEFDDSEYSVNLPFHLVDNYTDFDIEFSFDYVEAGVTYKFNRSVPVQIITPFLTEEEVRAVIGNNASYDEVVEAERLVRLLICAHTGEDFARGIKTFTLRGNDSGSLLLPERLIRVHGFNSYDHLPASFYLDSSGYYIRGGMVGPPSIKADFYGYHEINGVIYNPNHVAPSYFRATQMYSITGVFGWEEVPYEVKAAAKILLEEYFCDDSVYRDRYIDAVSAVDWRIQFNSGAFQRTGNVKADQLLANFIRQRGWAVL